MTTSYDGYTVEEATMYDTTATQAIRRDGRVVLEHHLLINGEVRYLQVDVTPYAIALTRDLLLAAHPSGVD